MTSTIAYQILDDYEEKAAECDQEEAHEWLWNTLEEVNVNHIQDGDSDQFVFSDLSKIEKRNNTYRAY